MPSQHEQERMLTANWFKLTRAEKRVANLPTSAEEWATRIGIHYSTVKRWIRIIKAGNRTDLPAMPTQKAIDKAVSQELVEQKLVDEAYDIPKDDEVKKKNVEDALYLKAADKKHPDHNAAFRLAQIKGWIKEKKEEQIDIRVIIAEAIAREGLKSANTGVDNRVDKVQTELPVLPEKLRLSTGQSENSDSKV